MFYLWFLRFFRPFIIAYGSWYVSFKKPLVGDEQLDIAEQVIKRGDFILTYKIGEATNLGIPGEYKHLGIYLGNGKVIEAVGSGVRVVRLDGFLYRKDKFRITRDTLLSPSSINAMIDWLYKQEGQRYDMDLSPENGMFYCYELGAVGYERVKGNKMCKFKSLGAEFYTDKTFIECDLFSDVYEFKGKI
jgi:hypothetical protein